MLSREHMTDLDVSSIAAKQRNWPTVWRMPRLRWICSLPEKGGTWAVDATPQMLLSSVRLSEAEKAHLEDLFRTYGIRKKWEERRGAAELHPDAISTTNRNLMEVQPLAHTSEACAASLAATRVLSQDRVRAHGFGYQHRRRCAVFQIPLGEAKTAVGLFCSVRSDDGSLRDT